MGNLEREFEEEHMKQLILVVSVLILAGCTQVNSLGIEPGENSIACLRGNSSTAAPAFGASVAGVTVEVSSNTDTSTWTPDDWAALIQACNFGV